MDRDIAPLRGSRRWRNADAWLMSDDAHGLGVIEAAGARISCTGVEADIPLQMGTLSKALGAYGGYVCASAAVIELIRNRARTVIYSTGLPPAMAAGTLAALDVIEREPVCCAFLWLRRSVCAPRRSAGAGQPDRSYCAQRGQGGPGSLANAGRRRFPRRRHKAPTVPVGTARLRLTFTAQHQRRDRATGRSSCAPHPCGRGQRKLIAMTAFFITATGTDIRRTFVTKGLIRHMHATGRPVARSNRSSADLIPMPGLRAIRRCCSRRWGVRWHWRRLSKSPRGGSRSRCRRIWRHDTRGVQLRSRRWSSFAVGQWLDARASF